MACYPGRMKEYGLDDFSNERSRAFIRSKSQAIYRGEAWNLTRAEYFRFWSTLELWNQRGRDRDGMVLTRFDVSKPWDRNNCCIITRLAHIRIKNARQHGKEFQHLYDQAQIYAE